MVAKYSVIQFVPDMITDERINIGVIVFNEETVRVRFLTKWDRVRRFANQDIKFLKSYAQEFQDAATPGEFLPAMRHYPRLNSEFVSRIIDNSINSVQFTESKASLKNVDDLLVEISARFLSEPVVNRRRYRDRRFASGLASSRIRHALIERVGSAVDAEALLKSHADLQGLHQRHLFDTVVENGVPYLAAHGISFELPEARNLQTQIDAIAWSIKDVHDFDPTLPIGVVTLPPVHGADEFERLIEMHEQTTRVYRDLGAEVLAEPTVDDWANFAVQRIPVHQIFPN